MIASADSGQRQVQRGRPDVLRRWLLCLILLAAPAWAREDAGARYYSLPAQPMQRALAQLASSSGLQILMAPQMLAGKAAPALSGRYHPLQALQELLAGSGLSYRLTGSGVVTIVPAVAADAVRPIAATPPLTMPAVASSLATLQVTGSRIARSSVEGPAPVTVITAEQMRREGHFSLSEALAMNGTSTYGAESQGAGGRFSANAQPLNLRGLGPGRSLILVDGRRVPDYPFPSNGRSNFQSLGSIPLASVERVELMTGGASAIYGADAIAGVVNIVLKQAHVGSQATLRTGTSSLGGGDHVDLQWFSGHGGDDWGLSYALQFSSAELLRGSQRNLQPPRNGDAANPFQPALGLGFVQAAGAAKGTLVAVPDTVCERWKGEFVDWDFAAASSPGPALRGHGCGSWRNAGYASLRDGVQALSGQMRAHWRVSTRMQAWAALQVWDARSELASGLELISGPFSASTGSVGEVYDPRFGYVAPQRLLTPQETGGLDAMNDRYGERMWDLALGLQGQYGQRLDWSLVGGRSDYRVQRDRRRLLGEAVNAFFFGEPMGMTDDGVIIQPLDLQHWYRPITPAEYSAMSGKVHYDALTRVEGVSYVVSGGVADVPAGVLDMAVVLEASRQRYRLRNTPSLLPLQMETYNLTGSVGEGVRDRYAVGAELGMPLTATIRASAAGRMDRYDDATAAATARTWSAGLEWRPLRRVLLRASHATSFKMPDMHWVFTDGGGSYGAAIDARRCIVAGAAPDCSGYESAFLTRTYRNPELDAETGTSTTAGLVWDASDALSISVDYWDVSNQGGIGRISPALLLRDEAECATGLRLDGSPSPLDLRSWECRRARQRVVRSGAQGEGRVVMVESTAANQSEQRVRGIDTVLDWRFGSSIGDFNLHAAWSRTLRGERRVRAPGTLHEQWREAQWTSAENPAFRSYLRSTLGWQGQGGWSVNVSGTRQGRLPRVDGQGSIKPLLLWNANVARQISPRTAVTLFINNLFDTAPPRDSSNDAFPYYYDAVYSAVGRQLAVQLDYNFD